MPLSEDEQRILRQIEEQLHRDPELTRATRPAGARPSPRFGLLLAGTVLLLLATVTALPVSPLVSFALFLAAVAVATLAERQLTSAARHGLDHLQQEMAAKFARRRGRQQRPG